MQNLTSLKQRSNGAVTNNGAGKNGLNLKTVARFQFDVAGKDSLGVANTTIAAHGTGTIIPINAVIIGGFIETNVAVTGVGASIAVSVMTANDVVSVAAISGAPWSVKGLKAIVPKYNTPESGIKVTSDKEVVFTVTGAVLAAGKVTGFLEYVIGDTTP